MESVLADLNYHFRCYTVLNTFYADIAFNFKTHDKKFKMWKLTCNIKFSIFFHFMLVRNKMFDCVCFDLKFQSYCEILELNFTVVAKLWKENENAI